MNRQDAINVGKILLNLIELNEVSIIKNTFVQAFLEKSLPAPGNSRAFLTGNFNIGGTVSGRLSSSDPNLQNIPSTGTKYAKAIKECFQAPPGWILAGADFSSLEDRISALTTKDPNKLKVYTDGYDGHSLRAFSYFGDQMEGIDPHDVDSINSIAQKYPHLRQRSKGPTFALTYGGTSHALVHQIGLEPQEAVEIEKRYHELYTVSDKWVEDKIQRATDDGYVTCAFGLRVRTPILSQVLLNRKGTPYEAYKESRTAGNALGQSYGLLNNRAAIEFQDRCLNSEHAENIRPIAHIHDAQYFMIKNRVDVVKWFNDNLIECMEWQDLPEIQHDEVKLEAEVSLFFPSWKDEIPLPNKASMHEIKEIVREYKKNRD